ncbi:Gluconate transport-inducing protein [Lithohypha guttulata]|uniref:Gluconate transport-inducing protein n=1 Tax=Lithohypha guttulata TaxID=1690604 RepID=A0AAN7SUJ8_9EURO|nr:Gluconate transport-inducing protein [Lithohypha guttulata]KAK5082022.1 Gluconate transport-inducing protein [Lithohypha guttulata]
METYNGHVRTPNDAIILFEACRLGLLPRVQRRLSEKERQSIRSGSVFVWDEREAGMRRWTDGKSWSASRVSGSFLTYREMEGKRGGNNFVQPVNGSSQPGNRTPEDADDAADGEEGPDGYRYKPDGLMKQSFSLTTSTGQHLHLISYFSRAQPTAQVLRQPSNDPTLTQIQIPKGMYPESTVADASNTPAVTRSPMPGAPNYVMATGAGFHRATPAPPPAFLPGYIPHPGYVYPLSPLHTPPGHFPIHYAHLPPGYYHPAAFGAPVHHPPPHHLINGAPPSSYDQRPQLRGPMPLPHSPHEHPYAMHNRMPQVVPPYHSQDKIPTTNTQAYPITPGPERSSSVQIDPRLTDSQGHPTTQSQPPTNGTAPSPKQYQLQPQPLHHQQHPHHQYQQSDPQSSLSLAAPSITSLVNAAAQASPLPTNSKPADTNGNSDTDRAGSVSPGGTRTVPPQDIPSEKLGFREDKMALSKLDRVFARV